MEVVAILPVAPLKTDHRITTTAIHCILLHMPLLPVLRVIIEEIIGVAAFVADLLQIEVAIAAPTSKALLGTPHLGHHRHHLLPLSLEAMGFL